MVQDPTILLWEVLHRGNNQSRIIGFNDDDGCGDHMAIGIPVHSMKKERRRSATRRSLLIFVDSLSRLCLHHMQS